MHEQLRVRVTVSVLAWLLGATAVFAQNPGDAPRERARQDGRFINRLRWTSPHGELPGTYAEYLRRHPLKSTRFSNRRVIPVLNPLGPRAQRAPLIAILVDGDLYAAITSSLSQYIADLTLEDLDTSRADVGDTMDRRHQMTPRELEWAAGKER